VRFSGSYSNHYAPDAKVLVNITPGIGDGMIALKEHLTPNGAIRLAAPKNCKEFAHQLYEAFRLGDRLKLKTICVFLPEGRGLELAIQDRVNKASNLLGDSNKFM
jgi:hypothetical protein